MRQNSHINSSWKKDICGDLSLLASLYLAHFIVWRTLRTRRKEREARLKNLKLIKTTVVSPDDRKTVVLMGE